MSVNTTLHHNPSQHYTPHGSGLHDRARLPINPKAIPQELRALNQWANWHGKKVIRDPHTGGNGSSTNPATWSPFSQAYKADPARLVFVFARDNGLVGSDIDDCRDAETGELDSRATDLIQRFPHIYWEISLSGTGVHGIGYGTLPEDVASRHPAGIGVKQHSGYFVMTGNPLPGYETLGAYGDELTPWYLESFAPKAKPNTSPPPALMMDDHTIVEKLRSEKSGTGIAGPLLSGDRTGYDDYSKARYALIHKVCFYSDDPEQIARIVRSSNLFKDEDRDRDRDRKALMEAKKAVSEYTGPRYDPGPRLSIVANTPPPNDVDRDTLLEENRALRAELARKEQTIIVLRERIRRADEREAIHKNTKLGAARQSAAALSTIFQDERPRDPDSPTGYRMPLAKLAERTGLSPDACSRQLRKLSDYRTEDGAPILHVETRDIPRTVNQATGEIIEPHKEIWAGPGIDPAAFGRVLATLAPVAAPKHGGAPDRNVCPEHPDAGTIRRSKTIRRITRECAHCHKVVDSTDIDVGQEERTYIPPIQHDAFSPEPDTNNPTRHDAFPADAEPSDPIPQHAVSTDKHTGVEQSSMLRHSSWTARAHQGRAEPQQSLPGASDDDTGPPEDWQDEHRRVYGEIYRGEKAS